MWIQAIGFVGSTLVAISLTMGNIWKLRWVNLFGAATFCSYGLLIGAVPVAALNGFIVLVDVVHLVRLSRRRDAFSFFEVGPQAPFLREFLRFWADDIRQFFPGFDLDDCHEPHIRLILRNMIPVGVFVCVDGGGRVAEVKLDWVAPGWRDLKGARFVFSASHERLKARGFDTFAATTDVPAHRRYLRKAGFRPDPKGPANRFLRGL